MEYYKNMAYNKRIVAFIDILGFKASVYKSAENESEFNRIKETIKILKDEIEDHKDDPNYYDTQITQISDSLIISRPLNERGGVFCLFEDISHTIHLLIKQGFLCRGSIQIGDMYHKESTLFGPAYIEAYVEESNIKLPIVKFNSEIFEVIRYFPGQEIGYAEWEVDFIANHCKELENEEYYFDYFSDYRSRYGDENGIETYNHYSQLRDIITEGLQSSVDSVKSKNRWAATEFNLVAKNYNIDVIEIF